MEIEESMRRHLGMPYEVEIENTKGEQDKLKFSPLPISEMPRLYSLLKCLKKASDAEPMKMMEDFDNTTLEIIRSLSVISMKPNYPNVTEDVLSEISLRNALIFMGALISNNMGMGSREMGEIKRRQAIARIRDKNAKSSGDIAEE